MDQADHDLRQRLLAIFQEEAKEHVAELSRHLLHLEKVPSDAASSESLEAAFRAVHSLKGAARAVEQSLIETVCEAMESIFSGLRRGKIKPTSDLFGLLLSAESVVEEFLADLGGGNGNRRAQVGPLLAALGNVQEDAFAPAESGRLSMTPPPAHTSHQSAVPGAGREPVGREPASASGGLVQSQTVTESIRVATAKLEAVRAQTEDLLAQKLEAEQHTADLKALWQTLRERGSAAAAGAFTSGELATRVRSLHLAARRHRNSLAAKTDRLLEDARQLLMVPCTSLTEGLPRVVRDLAQELGKEVDLEVTGAELEIDRHIVSELRDALVHVVRNALDHGLESPAERLASGKPRRGRLSVSIAQKPGKRVEINIEDDGRGIDLERVSQAIARVRGSSQEAGTSTSDEELLDWIFKSSVTTSRNVSGISGRGLGLAIVREKVEKIGGTVRLENRPGEGVRFSFDLPLSLATVRGIVLRVGSRRFVLPTSGVLRVVRVRAEQCASLANRPAVKIGTETLPLGRLSVLLQAGSLPEAPEREPSYGVLLVHHDDRAVVLADGVEREQEVLVKGLGIPVAKLPLVLGAAVLGSGAIAPILDPGAITRAVLRGELAASPQSSKEESAPPNRPKILVVEDSITSRTLMRGILQAAGYQADTAVDGLDALEKLREGSFDLVVSDIEMPRMDGITLTEQIRASHLLHDLPLVLVTSLHSAHDQQRGAQAGANAYLVKRDFRQSDLLDAVRRLL